MLWWKTSCVHLASGSKNVLMVNHYCKASNKKMPLQLSMTKDRLWCHFMACRYGHFQFGHSLSPRPEVHHHTELHGSRWRWGVSSQGSNCRSGGESTFRVVEGQVRKITHRESSNVRASRSILPWFWYWFHCLLFVILGITRRQAMHRPPFWCFSMSQRRSLVITRHWHPLQWVDYNLLLEGERQPGKKFCCPSVCIP